MRFIKMAWNSYEPWEKKGWKIVLTMVLAVQVSPLVYYWLH